MNDRIGKRFLSPRELGEYACDLLIVDRGDQDSLLQFLEKERMLVPAVRVRYPPEIIRHFWAREDTSNDVRHLPVESDVRRITAVEKLERQIHRWADVHAQLPWLHPLDEPCPEHSEFIIGDVSSVPFLTWDTYKIELGWYSDRPMKRDSAQTFYRYWQVFVLAEILETGQQTFINMFDEDLGIKMLMGKTDTIPAERRWQYVSVRGQYGLKDFPKHRSAFEALAFFLAYSERAYLEERKNQGHDINHLDERHWSTYQVRQKQIGTDALDRWSIDEHSILDFIKWQCRRWGDWTGLGQQKLADEYRRNIQESAELYSFVTGKDFETLVTEVGQVTMHSDLTLNVLFPDPLVKQSRHAVMVLRGSAEGAPSSFKLVGYDISAADCDGFVKWTVGNELYQFLWFFARLEELGHRTDLFGESGLEREVQGLCLTIEHIVNRIGDSIHDPVEKATWDSAKRKPGLLYKLSWLWDNVPDVLQSLSANRKLVRCDLGLSTQLSNIETIPAVGYYDDVVKHLLKVSLVRNCGVHVSLQGIGRKQTFELLGVLLQCMVLVWKHAKNRNFL